MLWRNAHFEHCFVIARLRTGSLTHILGTKGGPHENNSNDGAGGADRRQQFGAAHGAVAAARNQEGSLEYQVEGKAPVTLKAGEVLFIPAGTIHAAKNVGKGNGAELATYIVEKGKPLVVMVK